MAEECNNKNVWKLLFSSEYAKILEDYVKRLNNLTKKLHRVPDQKEVAKVVEKIREDYKLYDNEEYTWISYQHNSSNRASSEKSKNVQLVKGKKWNPY